MNKDNIKKVAKSTLTGAEIISSQTDPDFYGSLEVLPNPDKILRQMGRADEVYQAIAQDPHVMGEIRSSRAGLLKFEIKLVAGGESSEDLKALELCQQVWDGEPAPNMIWADVLWNMTKAQYYGFVVHEVVWGLVDNVLLPVKILDRKNSRFEFANDGRLLVKIKGKTKPVTVDENRILLTRHQPSSQNPYGAALFSSCFWSYTFKHSGFRSFTKFINKYGIPWAIGKYPQGTQDKERDELVMALQQMVEDAVAAIPDGNAVELVETKGGKNAPQESFIRLCNQEMSKALTSQTMATEQSSNGSRAAGEVAREREESVDTSQRVIVEATMNKLFRLITEFNVAGANPPTFKFYEKDNAPKGWVETLNKAAEKFDVSREYYQKMTGIQLAKNDADKLKTKTVADFTKSTNSFDDECEKQVNNLYDLLGDCADLSEFSEKLKTLEQSDDVDKALVLPILDEMIKGRDNV